MHYENERQEVSGMSLITIHQDAVKGREGNSQKERERERERERGGGQRNWFRFSPFLLDS